VKRLGAAAGILLLPALLLTGCAARLGVDVDLNRDGAGRLGLSLALDPDAQEELGFTADRAPEDVAAGLFPWLVAEPGWVAPGGGEGAHVLVQRDEAGNLALLTRHAIGSVNDLRALLRTKRSLSALRLRDTATDLADAVPLINDLNFSLGKGTGDHPGFDLFARGGAGEIRQATCGGNRLLDLGGTDARLRRGLQIVYRFRLPGGPGETNADDIRGGNTAEWSLFYGDCPPIRARSGGGSSSTLINGVILGVASALILLVLALRGLRRRRSPPTS
jgi:hypothetical protein